MEIKLLLTAEDLREIEALASATIDNGVVHIRYITGTAEEKQVRQTLGRVPHRIIGIVGTNLQR